MTRLAATTGLLPTYDVDLVSVEADESVVVERIFICNTTATTRTYTIRHYRANDSSAADNFCLFKDVSLKAHGTELIEAKLYLLPGDRLTASASVASSLVASAYGMASERR